ncbi:tape measure protein, partial [Salmonella enterica subsp. enterica serovar Typhi]|nr:tape measure protein [Salmonella enterica subsp. enterica serovar Typhi]
TKLWETLTSSLKEAGATNAQVLNLTDTLQKIGRIGGSSAEEMANAMRQFGQSIASGTIRAEEFNSILEQMPELARQIAAGLGISMGELRARMLDGKLTAEDALNAIQDRTSVVNAEFEKLPRTMDQAVSSLEVSFSNLVVAVNNATSASKTAVEIIDQLAKYIAFLGDKSTSASDKISSLATVISKLNPGAWVKMGIDALFGDDDIEKQKQYNDQVARFVKASKDGYEQTKKQAEATKHLKIAQAPTKNKKGKRKGKSAEERQAESVAEKLEKLRQQTMLNATSTSELSREQAILNAKQSLGKAATQEQIKLAGEYAAKIWDQKNALKEQASAEKERQRVE